MPVALIGGLLFCTQAVHYSRMQHGEVAADHSTSVAQFLNATSEESGDRGRPERQFFLNSSRPADPMNSSNSAAAFKSKLGHHSQVSVVCLRPEQHHL